MGIVLFWGLSIAFSDEYKLGSFAKKSGMIIEQNGHFVLYLEEIKL
jgi:hypothetical protein